MDDLGIDDPANVAGMSHLIDTSNSQSGFNFQELEEQITGGPRATRKKGNLAQELESEIDRLTGGYQKVEPSATIPFERPTMTTSDDIDALLNSVEEDIDSDGLAPPREGGQLSSHGSRFAAAYPDHIDDPDLAYMTNEQKRQNVIGEVFDDIDEERGQQPTFSVEKEKEEDEKSRKLEGIESLREILEDEGENLSRIPHVTAVSSMEEIDSVYKMLNLKNDRKRCCTFAEEGILLGAHAVEWAFDGEKNYFGHRPDMTDWHKSVQAKLRRMRHDTSNVVSQVMQHYNLGSGTRILLELIPSMFLYSRMRKSQHKDTLAVSDSEYDSALNRLRDADMPQE
jgi:hypothetical protein